MNARTVLVVFALAAAVHPFPVGAQGRPDHRPVETPEEGDLPLAEQDDGQEEKLVERLNEMLENPVDLNAASIAELMEVPGFDRNIALSIVERRVQTPLREVDDLLAIEGVDEALLRRVRPFVVVMPLGPVPSSALLVGSFRSRAEADVVGGPDEDVATMGNRWKLLHRLGVEHKNAPDGLHIASGLLVEKDAGEPRWADHVSWFCRLGLDRWGAEIILGDFAVAGAMGLALGSSGALLKGRDVLGLASWKDLSLRGRVSSAEPGGFRGIAGRWHWGLFDIMVFYSNRGIHARLDERSMVTSLYDAGLFRTPSEEAMRFRTRERVVGARAVVRLGESVCLGVIGLQSRFVHPLAKSPQSVAVHSYDLMLDAGRVLLASEAALDAEWHCAANLALKLRISRGLEALVFARTAPARFVSLHGYSMADRGGSPAGETGLYFGVSWKVAPWGVLRLFADQVRRAGADPDGFDRTSADVFVNIELRFSGSLVLELQARRKTFGQTVRAADPFGRMVPGPGTGWTQSYRLALSFRPAKAVRLKSLYELREVRTAATGNTDKGFSLSHGLSWQLTSWGSLGIRATAYETDSFDARISMWEPGVRGSLVQTLLYDEGFRWSAHVRVAFGPSLTAELLFQETDRKGQQVHSGRPLVENFERRRVGAQLEVRF